MGHLARSHQHIELDDGLWLPRTTQIWSSAYPAPTRKDVLADIFYVLFRISIANVCLPENTTSVATLSSVQAMSEHSSLFFELLDKARNGDAIAQYTVGAAFDAGDGVARDSQKAFEWYKKSADGGCVEALYSLAICYERAEGGLEDVEQAKRLYEAAAERGHSPSQFNLACLLEERHATEKDLESAFYWCLRAAKQDDERAMCNLGSYYASGQGTQENMQESLRWFILAALKGEVAARSNICRLFYVDELPTESPLPDLLSKQEWWKALESWHEAIVQLDEEDDSTNGVPEYNLGLILARGLGGGEDHERAAKLYVKAATKGQKRAQYILGSLYEKGGILPKSDEKAFEWYSKASTQGHTGATIKVAGYLKDGRGGSGTLKSRRGRAFSLFSQAAEEGDARAMHSVAMAYLSGDGVKKSKTRALLWFESAALKGLARAEYSAGYCYLKGVGLKKADKEKGVRYLRSAAEKGHADAAYQLGRCHQKGIGGLETDYVEAVKMFRRASESGNDKAARKMKHLNEKLLKQLSLFDEHEAQDRQ